MLSATKMTSEFLDKHCACLGFEEEPTVKDRRLSRHPFIISRTSERHFLVAHHVTTKDSVAPDPLVSFWHAPSGAWVPTWLLRWDGTEVTAVEFADDRPARIHMRRLRRLVDFCDAWLGERASRHRAALNLVQMRQGTPGKQLLCFEHVDRAARCADAQTAAVLDVVTAQLQPGKMRCIDNAPGIFEGLAVTCIAENSFLTEHFPDIDNGMPSPRVEWWRAPSGTWVPMVLAEAGLPDVEAAHLGTGNSLLAKPDVLKALVAFCNTWLGRDVLIDQGGIDAMRAASIDPGNQAF